MKTQTITLKLEGKSDGDIDLAREEAIKMIKGGSTSGHDSNDSGEYSFEVKNEFVIMKEEDITDEAEHIAAQFEDITENDLSNFALSSNGLDLEEFGGYIEGNLASMVQVIIDELGGIDEERDDDAVEKLNEFFEFDPPLSTLRNASSPKP